MIFYIDGKIDNVAVNAYGKAIVAELLEESKAMLAGRLAVEIVCKMVQQEMDDALALKTNETKAAQRLFEKLTDEALETWESRRGDWILALRQKYFQSVKAKLPRGKNKDGRKLGDLIKQLAKYHPNEKPSELWPHFGNALSSWADTCTERTIGAKMFFQYSLKKDHEKTISFKQFGVRLKGVRNTV